MTIEEFNNTSWGAGMTGKYHGDGLEYRIASCDFEECLIGLDGVVDGSDEYTWVRCENVTITGGLKLPREDEETAEMMDNLCGPASYTANS